MNMIDFFEKLGVMYPTDEDDETYNKRLCIYSEVLEEKIKQKNKEPDFESTFNYIAENYPYRTFPNFNYIQKSMKYKQEVKQNDKAVVLRGFRVKTDKRIYDFWGYIPPDEEVKFVRGFNVIEEIT